MISFYDHQKEAIEKLKPGSILCGGVGTGKSRTAIGYFKKHFKKHDLYIITTAKKRDTLEWEKECSPFVISNKRSCSEYGIQLTVDSWNNIKKYIKVKNAFFIFDEQRLVGSGTWVKSFLKIVKNNKWILLSATPGDTWSDYIPVFVANGFYKNRTEFLQEHAVYNRFTKYPKIEKYIGEGKLLKFRKGITVNMPYKRLTRSHNKLVPVKYDQEQYELVSKKRWNIFKNKPIKTISEVCYLLRKVSNQHPSRIEELKKIFTKHRKLIIFYNFDYELEMLRELSNKLKVTCAEWNGHKHEEVPNAESWFYLVQYTAGAEGWNCIKTDTIVFYSQNYSYKIMTQAAGRIDRLNTKFVDLYYYHLICTSSIDIAITNAIKKKKLFNIKGFEKNLLA